MWSGVCCESSVVDLETLANNDLGGDLTKRASSLCSPLAATNSEINDTTRSRSVAPMQGTRKFEVLLEKKIGGFLRSILMTMSR